MELTLTDLVVAVVFGSMGLVLLFSMICTFYAFEKCYSTKKRRVSDNPMSVGSVRS